MEFRRRLVFCREYCGASFVQQPDAPEVHTTSGGAGSSIISILEVSLISPNSEQEPESSYQTLTQSNHFAKVSKEQDVKYKQEESTNLKKAAGDRER